MNRVIITGADGFVGSYTTVEFLNHGAEVLAIGRNPEPKRLKQHEGLTYRCADVFDTENLKRTIGQSRYDMFLHMAWDGSAGPGRADHRLQLKNVESTVACLKLAAEIGCKRFVCAGSIMEKEAEAVMHTQGARPGMNYIYGIGKMTAHAMCKSVAAQCGIELVWPLITNAYGAGEISPRFVNTTIQKILNHEPLQFTAGTQNYDFIYITDAAKAFYLISQNGKPFCEYVIGSSDAKPLKEFVIEMIGALAPLEHPIFGGVPFTGVNLPLSAFDATETARDTGFKAQIGFAEGTRLTMEWLKTR